MQQFLQKYGRALDMSGAFLFVMATGVFAYYEQRFMAMAFWLGALAFFASCRAWGFRDSDRSQHRVNRTLCAVLASLSAAFFVASLIAWVLT